MKKTFKRKIISISLAVAMAFGFFALPIKAIGGAFADSSSPVLGTSLSAILQINNADLNSSKKIGDEVVLTTDVTAGAQYRVYAPDGILENDWENSYVENKIAFEKAGTYAIQYRLLNGSVYTYSRIFYVEVVASTATIENTTLLPEKAGKGDQITLPIVSVAGGSVTTKVFAPNGTEVEVSENKFSAIANPKDSTKKLLGIYTVIHTATVDGTVITKTETIEIVDSFTKPTVSLSISFSELYYGRKIGFDNVKVVDTDSNKVSANIFVAIKNGDSFVVGTSETIGVSISNDWTVPYNAANQTYTFYFYGTDCYGSEVSGNTTKTANGNVSIDMTDAKWMIPTVFDSATVTLPFAGYAFPTGYDLSDASYDAFKDTIKPGIEISYTDAEDKAIVVKAMTTYVEDAYNLDYTITKAGEVVTAGEEFDALKAIITKNANDWTFTKVDNISSYSVVFYITQPSISSSSAKKSSAFTMTYSATVLTEPEKAVCTPVITTDYSTIVENDEEFVIPTATANGGEKAGNGTKIAVAVATEPTTASIDGAKLCGDAIDLTGFVGTMTITYTATNAFNKTAEKVIVITVKNAASVADAPTLPSSYSYEISYSAIAGAVTTRAIELTDVITLLANTRYDVQIVTPSGKVFTPDIEMTTNKINSIKFDAIENGSHLINIIATAESGKSSSIALVVNVGDASSVAGANFNADISANRQTRKTLIGTTSTIEVGGTLVVAVPADQHIAVRSTTKRTGSFAYTNTNEVKFNQAGTYAIEFLTATGGIVKTATISVTNTTAPVLTFVNVPNSIVALSNDADNPTKVYLPLPSVKNVIGFETTITVKDGDNASIDVLADVNGKYFKATKVTKYIVTYSVKANAGDSSAVTKSFSITSGNVTAPTLAINGTNQSFTVAKDGDGVYTLQTATATDKYGIDISSSVAITVTNSDGTAITIADGKVTFTTAGTYTITYVATDSDGLKTTKTETIVVSFESATAEEDEADDEDKKGLSTAAIVLIVLASVAIALTATYLIVLAVRTKKFSKKRVSKRK